MSTAAATKLPSIDLQEPLDTRGVRWLLTGLGFATGMEFYTYDCVNLILPDLTGSLGISADEASWILTVYSSALFLGVPVSIWLAGHIGYKRFLIGSILVFAIALLGCATAPNLPAMLAWRAVQGLAGGGLVVWWRASIYLLCPKAQRSPSLMRVSTMLYLSSATGLLLGGYITDHANWRLTFLFTLAFGAIAVWLLARFFPPLPPPSSNRLTATDRLGIVLLAIALVSLQIVLSRGPIDDWLSAPRIRMLSFISASSLVLFTAWQASPHNREPLLRLDLLRNRNAMASALIGVCTGIILSGSLYVLPEYLRNIFPWQLSATQAGLVICIYALTAAAIRPFMVGVIARLGQRKAICGALLMLVLSMVSFSSLLTIETPPAAYIVPLMLYAICIAALLPAVGSSTVARIEQNQLLDGVSLYMTFRQFGASLGVTLLTILIDRRESLHSTRLFEHAWNGAILTQDWLARAGDFLRTRNGTAALQSKDMAMGLLAETAKQQAATLAYADAFIFMAAIGVITLILILIIPPTPPAAKK